MSDKKIISINADEDPELEALYRQATKTEPPGQLDNLIKQAARKTAPRKKSNLPQWFSGIAASVIVGVIVIQLYPSSMVQSPIVQPPPERSLGKVAPSPLTSRTLETESIASDEFEQDNMKRKRFEQNKSIAAMQETELARSPTLADNNSTSAAQKSTPQLASPPMTMQEMIPGNAIAPAGQKLSNAFAKRSPTEASKQRYSIKSDVTVSADMEADYSTAVPQLTAQQMLERVQKYIDEGELNKAKEEIKLLKQHYPEFEIKQEILMKLELP